MSFSAKSLRKIAEKSNLTKLNSIVCETNSYAKGQMEPTEEYTMAVSEMLEIIKYMNKPSVKKLSQKILDFFEENSNSTYTGKINDKIELGENQLFPKTKSLIAMVYRNYLCTLKERDLLDEILRDNNNYVFVQDGEQELDGECEDMADVLEVEKQDSHCVKPDEECDDEEFREFSLLDSEENDEDFEYDKKFNLYINVKDFDLEKQITKLKKIKKRLEKNRR